jgi:hypothetical protein
VLLLFLGWRTDQEQEQEQDHRTTPFGSALLTDLRGEPGVRPVQTASLSPYLLTALFVSFHNSEAMKIVSKRPRP